MADKTATLMALDTQSQGAIAPYLSAVDTSALQGPMAALFSRIASTMPWAPSNLGYIGQQVLAQGAFPRLRAFVPGEKRPAWLADDTRYTQWRKMITDIYRPIDLAFTSQNLALAAAETQAAANNTAVWDTIATYSGQAALEKIWQDLENALLAIKLQRDAANLAISTATEVINTHPNVPTNLVSQTESVRAKVAALDAKARAVLAPIPTASKEAGLGGLPIIIAGLAAATVAAVATAAWAIVAEFASVQKVAAANAQQVLSWRDQQDQTDYNAGRITAAELTARRRDNVDAANNIVTAQGAAAVGKAAGEAGRGIGSGIAMALGGVAVFGIAALLIVRFAKPR